ncbi:MAG: hypothetical protein DRI57_27405 [Deltaproteobacteria bacterium]|nr:MAG: hypothetical protein DRI57_27405 [Deltaproteobacteria bacterium]
MPTIEIEDSDYQYLRKSAIASGMTIPSFLRMIISEKCASDDKVFDDISVSEGQKQRGRWAKFSERIRQNPPLGNAGDYVRDCSKEFREDFVFRHDREKIS